MSVVTVLRADNWWSSKMPPLCGVLCATQLFHALAPTEAYVHLVTTFLCTGIAVGAYGHVINDVCDLEADARAGRVNRLAGFAPGARIALLLSLLAAAFAPMLVVDYGPGAQALLVGECLLVTLYSAKPVRLKDRGLLGVVADAGGAHLLPTLFLIVTFAHPGGGLRPADAPWVLALALWALALGLKNILWHQLQDREADRTAGIRTYATHVSAERVQHLIYTVCYPAEVIAFAAVTVVLAPRAPLLVGLLALALVQDGLKMRLGWRYDFAGTARGHGRHLPLLNNGFYESWFPLALATQLALREPALWALPAAILVVFYRNFRAQFVDLGALWRCLATRRRQRREPARWGWTLERHGAAAARLAAARGDGDLVRVELDVPSDVPWHVQLSRPPEPLHAGRCYELHFRIRADASRTLTLCVTRGQAPWDALGLSEELTVGDRWCDVTERFVATDSDDAGGIHLLLGGVAAPVEISGFTFAEIPSPAAHADTTDGEDP